MRTQKLLLALMLVAAQTPVAAGCASLAGQAYADRSQDRDQVMIDGKLVLRRAGTLLDLLRGQVPARRLGLDAPNQQPLIVLDGMIMYGGRLAEIGTNDVWRVTTLRGSEAFTRYGQQAYYGAVIIETSGRR